MKFYILQPFKTCTMARTGMKISVICVNYIYANK